MRLRDPLAHSCPRTLPRTTPEANPGQIAHRPRSRQGTHATTHNGGPPPNPRGFRSHSSGASRQIGGKGGDCSTAQSHKPKTVGRSESLRLEAKLQRQNRPRGEESSPGTRETESASTHPSTWLTLGRLLPSIAGLLFTRQAQNTLIGRPSQIPLSLDKPASSGGQKTMQRLSAWLP